MEDGDVINVFPAQCGSIGLFGQHSGSCGSELLQDERALLAASASDAKRIVDKLCPAGTPGKRGIVVGGEGVVLNSSACAALVGFVDELRRGETPHARIDVSHGKHDEHVQLSLAELQQLVGTEQAQRLAHLYQSSIDKVTAIGKITIRRVVAVPQHHWLAFHTDVDSCKTMQVALNHEDEYQGGRLVFVTKEGFVQPARPPGTYTIHHCNVPHGV